MVTDPIPDSLRRKIPAMVATELDAMSEAEYAAWAEEFTRRSKSFGLAVVTWLLFGWHYVYVRRWGVQLLFWCTAGGALIWWMIDLFRLGGIVDDYNKGVAVQVLKDQRALRG